MALKQRKSFNALFKTLVQFQLQSLEEESGPVPWGVWQGGAQRSP